MVEPPPGTPGQDNWKHSDLSGACAPRQWADVILGAHNRDVARRLLVGVTSSCDAQHPRRGKQKPFIIALTGPSGCGKTTLTHFLGKQTGLRVHSLNAVFDGNGTASELNSQFIVESGTGPLKHAYVLDAVEALCESDWAKCTRTLFKTGKATLPWNDVGPIVVTSAAPVPRFVHAVFRKLGAMVLSMRAPSPEIIGNILRAGCAKLGKSVSIADLPPDVTRCGDIRQAFIRLRFLGVSASDVNKHLSIFTACAELLRRGGGLGGRPANLVAGMGDMAMPMVAANYVQQCAHIGAHGGMEQLARAADAISWCDTVHWACAALPNVMGWTIHTITTAEGVFSHSNPPPPFQGRRPPLQFPTQLMGLCGATSARSRGAAEVIDVTMRAYETAVADGNSKVLKACMYRGPTWKTDVRRMHGVSAIGARLTRRRKSSARAQASIRTDQASSTVCDVLAPCSRDDDAVDMFEALVCRIRSAHSWSTWRPASMFAGV